MIRVKFERGGKGRAVMVLWGSDPDLDLTVLHSVI